MGAPSPLSLQFSPAGRRSAPAPPVTLLALALARCGFVRGGPGRLGDLLVRVVLAEVIEHVLGVRVRAAHHRLEQGNLLAQRYRLAEADREVARVRGLVVAGERQ